MSDTNAAPVNADKRSIAMKFFRDKAVFARVGAADAGTTERLGQIIGNVYAMKVKSGVLPSGELKESIAAIGEFEATNFNTGEEVRSSTVYLPGYFAEQLQAVMERNGNQPVLFAVNILATATGKTIPVAYEVENIVQRAPENPLDALKRQLAATGKLRLSAPPGAPQLEGSADQTAPEPEAVEKPAPKRGAKAA